MGSSASIAGAQKPESDKAGPYPQFRREVPSSNPAYHLASAGGGGSPSPSWDHGPPLSVPSTHPPHLCNSLLSSSSASKWEKPKAR